MAAQQNDSQDSCVHSDECDDIKEKCDEKLRMESESQCASHERVGDGCCVPDDDSTLESLPKCVSHVAAVDNDSIVTVDIKPESSPQETVNLKVTFKKQKFDVNFPLDEKISDLKAHLQKLTSVPSPMQKIMYKGLAKDESTLRSLKMTNGAKIIVIGSTINDVLEVATPTDTAAQAATSTPTKEPLCKNKIHQKVLEKYGKPEDAITGIKNRKERLPGCPLSGMYNKNGGKVRLTFKLELDQLWIGTKERTEKIPMNSIKAVVSEAIEGHEEYHLMGIQLGPTEASRYWVYWVPAQYVDAVKDAILGKWQF